MDIQTLIDKLNTYKPRQREAYSRSRIGRVVKALKDRNLGFSEACITHMSILLSGYDLTKFTDNDLIVLSRLDLRRLELATPSYKDKQVSLKFNNPMFDTGTVRVLAQVPIVTNVSSSSVVNPTQLVISLLGSYKP